MFRVALQPLADGGGTGGCVQYGGRICQFLPGRQGRVGTANSGALGSGHRLQCPPELLFKLATLGFLDGLGQRRCDGLCLAVTVACEYGQAQFMRRNFATQLRG